MGWAIGFDTNWNRDIGYGVPAICDHPRCMAKINRGLSYVCGGNPFGGDKGCGLYFCVEHLSGSPQRCSRCLNRKQPFSIKADHLDWIRHKLTHESWATWRSKHPNLVAEYRNLSNVFVE